MRKILFLLAIVFSSSWAGFFIDEGASAKAEPSRELPTWFYGGSVDLGYYIRSIDVGVNLEGEYRLGKHNSLALFADGLFPGCVFGVGLDWRFFFGGSLMELTYDDFVKVGFSGVFVKNYDELNVAPMISLGYGRDFMPLQKASFLVRLEISVGYMFGEGIVEDDKDAFLNRETNLLAHFNIGVLLF